MSQLNEPDSSPLPPVGSPSVDSGEYFRNGRLWARTLFDAPITERSYALLAMLMVGTAFFTSFLILSSLFPLSAPVKLVFVNNNSGFEFPRMVRLAQPGEPLQHSIASYIAKQYVTAYESYIYDRDVIDQRYRLVYNQSAPEVFQKYRTLLDPNNSQSPLNLLEQQGVREISDLFVQINNTRINDGVFSATADVYYNEVIRTATAPKIARKMARLHFTMLELNIHKADKSVYQYNPETQTMEPLVGRILFRVNAYETRPVKHD